MAPSTPDQVVEIVPYDPAWPARFLEERSRLACVLGPWISGPIEHIGSTAVPGLPAKPIIDIMLPVASLAGSIGVIEAARALDYLHHPYKAEEMHWFCKPSPWHRTHHLHVVVFGAAAWCERLALRNLLREDPVLARQYAALKRELAQAHRFDRDAYTQAKAPFLRAALMRACGPAPRA